VPGAFHPVRRHLCEGQQTSDTSDVDAGSGAEISKVVFGSHSDYTASGL
jgi:hypothetical protein